MRLKEVKRASLVLACVCATALNAPEVPDFVWTANGDGRSWKDCNNWDPENPQLCFPFSVTDDVQIPGPGSPWTIDLITVQIEDLLIEGSVTFGSENTTPTLTVDSVHIVGGATTSTVVVMTAAAAIQANGL